MLNVRILQDSCQACISSDKTSVIEVRGLNSHPAKYCRRPDVILFITLVNLPERLDASVLFRPSKSQISKEVPVIFYCFMNLIGSVIF